MKKRQPPVKKRAARRTPVRAPAQRGKKAAELPEKRKRAAAAFVGDAKGSKAEAMRQAGYGEKTATHQQGRVFGDPRVQKEIGRLLIGAGIDDKLVASRLRESLDAMEMHFYRDAPGPDCVAHDVRLEAQKLYWQLTGRLKDKPDVNVVAVAWTEQIVQVVIKYVPADRRHECLDEVIRSLSQGGVGVAGNAAG